MSSNDNAKTSKNTTTTSVTATSVSSNSALEQLTNATTSSVTATTQPTNSTTPQSKPITFSDGYELVSKKILINRLSIENLKYQKAYCELFKKIQNMTWIIADKKILLIEQLSKIFEGQLREFTQERQNECLAVYEQINELDTPSAEFTSTCSQLENLRSKMEDLIAKISYLERTIPNEQIVTNSTLRFNRSN